MSLVANHRPRPAVEMLDATFQMYRACFGGIGECVSGDAIRR